MRQKPGPRKPTWWLLCAIGALMLSLLALIAALVDEGIGRTILEGAVVVLVTPWMLVWVRCNRAAMEFEDWRARSGRHGPAIVPPRENGQGTLRAIDAGFGGTTPVRRVDRGRPATSGSRSR